MLTSVVTPLGVPLTKTPHNHTGGAANPLPHYTDAEVQALADQHFAQAYRLPLRTHLLDLVAAYGVLTGDQLYRLALRRFQLSGTFAHFDRNLRRMCELGLLLRLPEMTVELRQAGLRPKSTAPNAAKDTRYRLYGVGPIGNAVAQRLWQVLGRNLHGLLPPDSLLHDVLCAEATLRLAESDPALLPVPPAQLVLWDAVGQKFLHRPDGMLVRHSGLTPVRAWLVEFANESWTDRARAQHKLELYAALQHSRRWVEWDLNGTPELLVIYRARSTARAFAALAPQLLGGQANAVLGLALEEALAAPNPTPRPIGECLKSNEGDE